MPQPIQGPTLAEVAVAKERDLKEQRAAGKITAKKLAELKKLSDQTGATQKERARQRAIYKEMRKYQLKQKGAPSTRKYNSLFRESDRIAARARKRMAEKEAAAAKKAAKVKAAKKKAAKKKKAPAKKKKAPAKKKPAKKTAKKSPAKKAARPVKKAAKKSR